MVAIREAGARVLILYYSLSGETSSVVETFAQGLEKGGVSEVVTRKIEVDPPFPFPWSLWDFFDVMPETIQPHKSTRSAVPPSDADRNDGDFDLVVLGWQTWFLSPSLPVRLTVQSPEYDTVFRGKPVLLLGTHRNMWHVASDILERDLATKTAKVVARVNFVQQSNFLQSVVNTVRFQFGGRKGSGSISATATGKAFESGLEYGRLVTTQQAIPSSFQAGAPPRQAIAVVEKLWYPVKVQVSTVMNLFAPGSLPRKGISCVYGLVLAAAIVVAVPTILVGTLLENVLHPVLRPRKNETGREVETRA